MVFDHYLYCKLHTAANMADGNANCTSADLTDLFRQHGVMDEDECTQYEDAQQSFAHDGTDPRQCWQDMMLMTTMMTMMMMMTIMLIVHVG